MNGAPALNRAGAFFICYYASLDIDPSINWNIDANMKTRQTKIPSNLTEMMGFTFRKQTFLPKPPQATLF